MSATASAPISDVDLFADHVRNDPYPVYAQLRDLGPAVWLPALGVWTLPRHADVRRVLGDPLTFRSRGGVALTSEANAALAGTSLGADGSTHARLRRPVGRLLMLHALRETDALAIHQRADDLVAQLVVRQSFDAVDDLVAPLVIEAIFEMAGVPSAVRAPLVAGSAAFLDLCGPPNDRYHRAGNAAHVAQAAMDRLLGGAVSREAIRPGSWRAVLDRAVAAGDLVPREVPALLSGYLALGVHPTINALSTVLGLLATHPKQWGHLRARRVTPVRVTHEALRYDAPLQALGRRATRPVRIGPAEIGVGEQVLLLFGSAGRDQSQWGETANRFDVQRPHPEDHLALGYGPHLCVGVHLVFLLATAILGSLASRCTRLQPTAPGTRAAHNLLRGWRHLPITVTPDGRRKPK